MEIAPGLQVMDKEEEELRILSCRILRSWIECFQRFLSCIYLCQFISTLFSRDATRGILWKPPLGLQLCTEIDRDSHSYGPKIVKYV